MSIEIEQWHVVGFFSQKEFLVKLTRLVGFVVQCRSFYNYVGCSTISFSSKLATKRPSEWSSSMAFECGSEWSVRIQANLFQLMKSSLLQSNISVWITTYNTITMLISGPYLFTASTLLVQAFIPMAHGPWIQRRDPFNQNSKRSDREKRSTSKGGPVFWKLFRLDQTDPLSFRPKFPEILVEWIAPQASMSVQTSPLKIRLKITSR